MRLYLGPARPRVGKHYFFCPRARAHGGERRRTRSRSSLDFYVCAPGERAPPEIVTLRRAASLPGDFEITFKLFDLIRLFGYFTGFLNSPRFAYFSLRGASLLSFSEAIRIGEWTFEGPFESVML